MLSRVASLLAIAVAGPLMTATPSAATTQPPEPQVPGDMSNSPTEGTAGVGNVAHRGFSVAAPENTMPAVRQAIAEAGDFQGVDVHRTADSRLVVLHDRSLARTTNVERVYPDRAPWDVSDFTYDELQRLDAGSWFHGSYTGTRIPTLGTMLSSLDQAPSGIFLEVKQPSESPGIGDQVVQAIRDNTDWLEAGGTDHRLVVQSFDEGFLEDLHDRYPNIPVGALGAYDPADLEWLDQVNVNHDQLTADEVDRVHQAGAQISTFVVNTREEMQEVLDAGVDAVSTDRPRLLHDVLVERGQAMPHPAYRAQRATLAGSAWDVSAPATARLATRIPVSSTLKDDSGNPVRWSWVTLQTYYNGAWHPIQHRATDLDGHVTTSLWLRRDVELRWVPSQEAPTGSGPSAAVRVDAEKSPTVARLGGPSRIRRGSRARLTVRWYSDQGRPISGRSELWARPRGADHWSLIRSRRVHDGHRTFWVRPRRTTRYQLRAKAGWWWHADRNRHRVVVRR